MNTKSRRISTEIEHAIALDDRKTTMNESMKDVIQDQRVITERNERHWFQRTSDALCAVTVCAEWLRNLNEEQSKSSGRLSEATPCRKSKRQTYEQVEPNKCVSILCRAQCSDCIFETDFTHRDESN